MKLRAEAAEKLGEDIARREALAERKIATLEAQAAEVKVARRADRCRDRLVVSAVVDETKSDPRRRRRSNNWEFGSSESARVRFSNAAGDTVARADSMAAGLRSRLPVAKSRIIS